MKRHTYYVYILASIARVLYTGMTKYLEKRVAEHKSGEIEGFTSQFRECRLVYWESFDDVRKAISREKQIKGWRREKKVALIESMNRDWHDLSVEAKAWSLDSPLTQGSRLPRDDRPVGFRKVKDARKRTRPKPYNPLLRPS